MATVTKDMTIGEVMTIDNSTAEIFMAHGMHCLWCPHSINESVAEASMVHGVDPDELVNALNAYLDSKNA